MHSIRTILHPTDFSKHSDVALEVAGTLARDYKAKLVVFHVLHAAEPPDWLYDRMAGAFPWTVDCHHALEQRVRLLRQSDPNLLIEIQVAEGVPAEEILRAAQATDCGLIVMGSHGRTGPDGNLIGGVAESVMRQAHCSVLIVKEPVATMAGAKSSKEGEPASAADAS